MMLGSIYLNRCENINPQKSRRQTSKYPHGSMSYPFLKSVFSCHRNIFGITWVIATSLAPQGSILPPLK